MKGATDDDSSDERKPPRCLACLARRAAWGRWTTLAALMGTFVGTNTVAVLGARRLQPEPVEREVVVERIVRVDAPKSDSTELERLRRELEVANGKVSLLSQVKASLESDVSTLRLAYADARNALKEKEYALGMLLGDDRAPTVLLWRMPPPPPDIDTRVIAIKTDVRPPLVLLSAGADDNVEKGLHFSIYRGTEFVAKVVVEKVLTASCGCRVLFTKEGMSIQAGDSAATRFR